MLTLENAATLWRGCYDDSWKGYIVDEAFAHPAKAARGLLERIFDYLFANEFIHHGETVVDPFGGIGTTGIVGASRGLRVFGCELEPKFHALALCNFDLHRATWERMGDPLPVMVCGDSRRLREVFAEAECIVGSPPYATGTIHDAVNKNGEPFIDVGKIKGNKPGKHGQHNLEGYGQTPGQLGAMRAGEVDAVVGSPPFMEAQTGGGIAIEGVSDDCKGNISGNARRPGARSYMPENQGDSPGNLAAMPPGSVADCVVSSPPFMLSDNRGGDKSDKLPRNQGRSIGPCYSDESPTDSTIGGDRTSAEARAAQSERASKVSNLGNIVSVGNGGDLVNLETFWTAARDIVSECHAILKPGGVAVWIVKAFVRNKAIVDFPGDWLKLCLACGFEFAEEIHASLVKESRNADLFGGEQVERTERKSFFRRLCEKRGSPRIDHETVIVVRKPNGVGDGVACVVSSPPFLATEGGCKPVNGDTALMERHSATGVERYGTTPGQLGGMTPGRVEDVL